MANPDNELTLEKVRGARREVCQGIRRPDFGEGEFRYLVFETLAGKLDVPLKDIGITKIPDYEHPLVAKLSKDLVNFREEIDRECQF